MSKYSKIFLITGVILLAYGYLCRLVPIDFFWDSRTIGWVFLFISLLAYWIALRKTRKQANKKTTLINIGIGFLLLGLVMLPVAVFILSNSAAYSAATQYLQSDSRIQNEVGDIKGFGLIPTGSVQVSTINGIESGHATFEIIVRGSKKYKDVTVDLQKTSGNSWTVTDVR